jgi:isopenicillin N synthase-like dioxygenase
MTASRFVPFGSEKIRDEPHLDETMEFQHGVYELEGTWSDPGRRLLEASRILHKVCACPLRFNFHVRYRYITNVTKKKECNRVQFNLLDILSSSINLPHSLSSIHSKRNSFFAPYYYSFEGINDTNPLRVPPHIDPTTMLFNFQDSHGGLEVADLSNTTGCLSATSVERTANFIPVHCQPGEFLVLAGHVLRRLVPNVKHSVHRVKRPVGISGFHLNYWIVPDLDTSCDFGEKKEDVAAYLARVFPAALRNTVQA